MDYIKNIKAYLKARQGLPHCKNLDIIHGIDSPKGEADLLVSDIEKLIMRCTDLENWVRMAVQKSAECLGDLDTLEAALKEQKAAGNG